MNGLVAILPGDGISAEIMPEALKVLDSVQGPDLDLRVEHGLIGNAAVDVHGDFLPEATVELAKRADAILLGAVATPPFRAGGGARKSSGLLRLRKELDVYANLRPIRIFPDLIDASPLKPDVVRGVDMLVIRELTGDLYYGEPRGMLPDERERVSVNTMRYSESEIRRVAHVAFRHAKARRGKVCSMDKANVLETSGLWRDVVVEVAALYPDVELTHMLVDAGAMALVRAPDEFDVVLTANLFGDILSDQAAMIAGSIGMVPSASLGDGSKGLYEPIHGSAPDIAGRNIANPLAIILSVALMLRWTFNRPAEAGRIEAAVGRVLAAGLRTRDIADAHRPHICTAEMGDAIVAEIRKAEPRHAA